MGIRIRGYLRLAVLNGVCSNLVAERRGVYCIVGASTTKLKHAHPAPHAMATQQAANDLALCLVSLYISQSLGSNSWIKMCVCVCVLFDTSLGHANNGAALLSSAEVFVMDATPVLPPPLGQ